MEIGKEKHADIKKYIFNAILILIWAVINIYVYGVSSIWAVIAVCAEAVVIMCKVDRAKCVITLCLLLDLVWRLDTAVITYKEDRILLSLLIGLILALYLLKAEKEMCVKSYTLIIAVIVAFMFFGYNLLYTSSHRWEIRALEFIIFGAGAFYAVNIGAELFDIKYVKQPDKLSRKKVTIICFCSMFFASFLLLMIYYPGIYSTDVITCWKQAESIADIYTRSDAHSFLYIVLLAIFQGFSKNIFWVCFVNVILLSVTMACIFGYLYEKGLKFATILLLVFLYVIFPSNMHLTISATKDVIFTIALLQLTFSVIKMLYEKEKFLGKTSNIVQLAVAGVGTALLRSNGLVAALAVCVCIIVYFWKSVRKRAIVAACTIIILIVGVKLPLYSWLNVKSGAYGLASLPFLDGIWLNVYLDNSLSPEIKEYLEDMMPLEEWRDKYIVEHTNSYVLDYSKLDTLKSIEGWLWCLWNHPMTTVRSRLCKTQAIWSVFQTEDSYYSYNITVESHPRAEMYGWYYLDRTEKIREIYVNYFLKKPFSRGFIILGNGGWNLFIWLLIINNLIKEKKGKKILILAPIGGSCVALLLCCCFSDYRYVWPMSLITLIFTALAKTDESRVQIEQIEKEKI